VPRTVTVRISFRQLQLAPLSLVHLSLGKLCARLRDEMLLCKQHIQRELFLFDSLLRMLAVIVGGLVVIAGVLATAVAAG